MKLPGIGASPREKAPRQNPRIRAPLLFSCSRVRGPRLGRWRPKLLGKLAFEQVRAGHVIESHFEAAKSLHPRVAIQKQIPDLDARTHLLHLETNRGKSDGQNPEGNQGSSSSGGHGDSPPALTTERRRALRARGFLLISSSEGASGLGFTSW